MTKPKLHTRDLCIIGTFTAVIAVMSQITIPMPFGVPLTMQTFAILLAGIVLGARKGCIATLVYILLGAIGLPVFAEFSGGFNIIAGPTGGFILSFPIMAFLAGLGREYRHKSNIYFVLCLTLSLIINYVCGVAMFCLLTKSSILIGFTACVLPFIISDLVKAVLASLLGIELQKRLGGILCD